MNQTETVAKNSNAQILQRYFPVVLMPWFTATVSVWFIVSGYYSFVIFGNLKRLYLLLSKNIKINILTPLKRNNVIDCTNIVFNLYNPNNIV